MLLLVICVHYDSQIQFNFKGKRWNLPKWAFGNFVPTANRTATDSRPRDIGLAIGQMVVPFASKAPRPALRRVWPRVHLVEYASVDAYQPIWLETHCSRLAAGIAPEMRATSLPD